MASVAIYLLALMMLAGCATQQPDAASEACRPSAAKRVLADTLTGGAAEIGFTSRQRVCEENYHTVQEAVEVCGHILKANIDKCHATCFPTSSTTDQARKCAADAQPCRVVFAMRVVGRQYRTRRVRAACLHLQPDRR